MSKLTVVVPARNELYLQRTIDDLFAKAAGDIEVILVLDNYWPVPIIADHLGLTIVHWGGRRGMRAAINAGAEIGKGEYILKCDAHVLFDEGYDEKLAAACDVDWVVVPRRYSLEPDGWKIREGRPVIDYEYLGYPFGNDTPGLHARHWKERQAQRTGPEFLLDETMSFQGSCWFMKMEYFRRLIYPMDEAGYGMFIGEPQEVGLKVWLAGGKTMVNKSTWYAHLWKGHAYRELHQQVMGFPYTRVGQHDLDKGNAYNIDFWFYNRWQQRKHDLSWLIERFWPVPTWPDDRNLWTHAPGS